jgi:hypothetical protein
MRTILLLAVILSFMSCSKDILTEDNPKMVSNDTLYIRVKWVGSFPYSDSMLLERSGWEHNSKVPSQGGGNFYYPTNTDFSWTMTKVKNIDAQVKVSIYVHHGNIVSQKGDSLVYQTTQSGNPIVIKGKFSDVGFHSTN